MRELKYLAEWVWPRRPRWCRQNKREGRGEENVAKFFRKKETYSRCLIKVDAKQKQNLKGIPLSGQILNYNSTRLVIMYIRLIKLTDATCGL